MTNKANFGVARAYTNAVAGKVGLEVVLSFGSNASEVVELCV